MYNSFFKSIEQIAAALAHEVKNPLSLVRANLELLELYDEKKEHNKNFMVMKREIDKINNLLMDFNQLYRPVDKASFEPFSLSSLVEGIIESYESLYAGRIMFPKIIHGECIVTGEMRLISKVLANVYKNAVESVSEACQENGKIESVLYDNESCYILEVVDNGGGLSDDAIESVGKPFYTTKKNGTGLGLLIIKSIMSSHDGDFVLENNETGGCKAKIKIMKQIKKER